MPVGSADHMMNSRYTSAERKCDLGGRAAPAYLLLVAEHPPPRRGLFPRPREAATGTIGCLRGRPGPRFAGVESGPSWRAFPFSTAENLFRRAMGMASSQEGEGE